MPHGVPVPCVVDSHDFGVLPRCHRAPRGSGVWVLSLVGGCDGGCVYDGVLMFGMRVARLAAIEAHHPAEAPSFVPRSCSPNQAHWLHGAAGWVVRLHMVGQCARFRMCQPSALVMALALGQCKHGWYTDYKSLCGSTCASLHICAQVWAGSCSLAHVLHACARVSWATRVCALLDAFMMTPRLACASVSNTLTEACVCRRGGGVITGSMMARG